MHSQEPILTRLDKVFSLLKDENLLQEAQMVHPSEWLCHQATRGGLGLNPYNVHKVGAKVQRVGANLQCLNTVLSQLHPDSAQADKQKQVNKALVAASDGLLASITGSDKYLHVVFILILLII